MEPRTTDKLKYQTMFVNKMLPVRNVLSITSMHYSTNLLKQIEEGNQNMQDTIRNSIKQKMLAAGPDRAVMVTPEEFKYVFENGVDNIIAEVEMLEKQKAAMPQSAVAGVKTDQREGNGTVNAGVEKAYDNTACGVCPECQKLDAELNTLLQPVMAFMRRECNPHTKIILDGDAAEIVSGERMILAAEETAAVPFNPVVTKENLKVGEFVTVKEWYATDTGFRDQSYRGELLKVTGLEWPHVFVDRVSEYGHKADPLRLNADRVVFTRLSKGFLDAFNMQLEQRGKEKIA